MELKDDGKLSNDNATINIHKMSVLHTWCVSINYCICMSCYERSVQDSSTHNFRNGHALCELIELFNRLITTIYHRPQRYLLLYIVHFNIMGHYSMMGHSAPWVLREKYMVLREGIFPSLDKAVFKTSKDGKACGRRAHDINQK